MGIEYLGNGAPDGTMLQGEKLGFYDKTPIARPSVTWPNTGTATTTLNETKVNRIMAALVAIGIIVTT